MAYKYKEKELKEVFERLDRMTKNAHYKDLQKTILNYYDRMKKGFMPKDLARRFFESKNNANNAKHTARVEAQNAAKKEAVKNAKTKIAREISEATGKFIKCNGRSFSTGA